MQCHREPTIHVRHPFTPRLVASCDNFCLWQVDVEGSELQVLQGIEHRHWADIKQVFLPLLTMPLWPVTPTVSMGDCRVIQGIHTMLNSVLCSCFFYLVCWSTCASICRCCLIRELCSRLCNLNGHFRKLVSLAPHVEKQKTSLLKMSSRHMNDVHSVLYKMKCALAFRENSQFRF